MKILFYLILAWGCSCTFVTGQKLILDSEKLANLDRIASRDVPENAPGIATAVIRNGKVIYSWYGGYARLDSMTLISSATRFNLASNGKQFTALAVLFLESRGMLRLQEDIRLYFPELFKNIPSPITLNHLLTHTSGIRDVYDLWSLQGITWWKNSFDNQVALDLLSSQQTLNFSPGEKYAYSNSNYILLAQVVEKVSGQSFADFSRNMFLRLGMEHTSFENQYDRIQDPIALPYFNFDTWQGYEWIWNVVGDGNLFSPLADQVKWEIMLQTKQIPEEWKEAVMKSQAPVENIPGNYGYGLEFGEYNGQPYRFHEGSTGAWKATTVRFEDFAIVTLSNSGKTLTDIQTRQMAAVLLGLDGQPAPFATAPKSIGPYITEDALIGLYETAEGFLFKFERREDGIYLIRNGRNDVRLTRRSPNVFNQEFDPAFIQEFVRDSLGRLTVTAYYTTHAPYTLTKIEPDWTAFNFAGIAGIYYNEELDLNISVIYTGERTYRVSLGKREMHGELIRPDELRFGEYSIDLSKAMENELSLYTNRSANLVFRRTGK